MGLFKNTEQLVRLGDISPGKRRDPDDTEGGPLLLSDRDYGSTKDRWAAYKREQEDLQAFELTEHNHYDFCLRPVPQGVTVKCRIRRVSSAFPSYSLEIEVDDKKVFIMSAWMVRNWFSPSTYLISLDANGQSGDLCSIVGKVRSNALGTQFTVFPSGTVGSASISENDTGAQLAGIMYEINLLGLKGPRKMTCILPAMTIGGRRIEFQPLATHDGIIERWTEKKEMAEDLLELKQTRPIWREDTQSYGINFRGRVTEASVKNFQLFLNTNANNIVLQFGKVGKDLFTMDYAYPLCALQAFGIALTSLDNKLACA